MQKRDRWISLITGEESKKVERGRGINLMTGNWRYFQSYYFNINKWKLELVLITLVCDATPAGQRQRWWTETHSQGQTQTNTLTLTSFWRVASTSRLRWQQGACLRHRRCWRCSSLLWPLGGSVDLHKKTMLQSTVEKPEWQQAGEIQREKKMIKKKL